MLPIILKTIRQAKRLIVVAIGFTVLLIGIAMIVLPGIAVVAIPLGLGILATELIWDRKLIDKLKSKIQKRKESNHAD